MTRLTLTIEGMTCQGCVKSVQNAISDLNGVQAVTVDLATKQAVIDYDQTVLDKTQITQTIEDAGFDIE